MQKPKLFETFRTFEHSKKTYKHRCSNVAFVGDGQMSVSSYFEIATATIPAFSLFLVLHLLCGFNQSINHDHHVMSFSYYQVHYSHSFGVPTNLCLCPHIYPC